MKIGEGRLVLVTGPDGFVGTQLCSELLLKGFTVRGAQWQPAPLPEGCESLSVGDIDDQTQWGNALSGVEAIVHLAARVHQMKDSAPDPLAEFRKTNVHGTRRLAEAAAAADVKRFVFISSVKVNGEATKELPFSENSPPAPQDAYGISKWEAEQALQDIARKTGLEVVVLRPPLMYGPGVKANFLQLFHLAARGIPLPFAMVRNRRSFMAVRNLCDVIVACLCNPMAKGGTYLLSDGEDISTADLIRKIAQALGRPARLLPFPLRLLVLAGKMLGKGDMVQRLIGSLQVDSSLIRRELNWSPPVTMDEELKRTAKWFLSQRGHSVK